MSWGTHASQSEPIFRERDFTDWNRSAYWIEEVQMHLQIMPKGFKYELCIEIITLCNTQNYIFLLILGHSYVHCNLSFYFKMLNRLKPKWVLDRKGSNATPKYINKDLNMNSIWIKLHFKNTIVSFCIWLFFGTKASKGFKYEFRMEIIAR